MILAHRSQRDYGELAGKPGDRPTWSHHDFVAMATFMREFAAEHGHAFMAGVWLQLAPLGAPAALTVALPGRISADPYKPHI
jgi:hypothetical protein